MSPRNLALCGKGYSDDALPCSRSSATALSVAIFCAFLLHCGAQCTYGQNASPSIERAQGAVSLLSRVVASAGGTAINSIQSFTGKGTITYFWANEPVSGEATVWGLGISSFRLDAALPGGLRSWTVTDAGGQIRNLDGTTADIQFENAAVLGGLAYPYLRMAAALADPSFSITESNVVADNGQPCVGLTITQTFPLSDDPTGDERRLSTKTYVVDPTTASLVETIDTLWSTDGRMRPVIHRMIFSDIRVIDGRSVPFLLTEKVGGQETWTLQFSSFAFNENVPQSFFGM